MSDFKDAYDAGGQHAAELARLQQGQIEDIGAVKVLRIGKDIIPLEKFLPAPVAKRGNLGLFDTASFCAYVNQHKTDGTQIFGNLDKSELCAVLDHHTKDVAQWGRHRVWLTARLTQEWKDWTAANQKPMTQVQLSEFVDNHITEIAEPSGGALVEMITHLDVKRDVTFSSAVRLQDGLTQFTFHEADTSRGTMEIPKDFVLGIKPFEGADVVTLRARLRYRIDGGKLVMWFDLLNPTKALEAAFRVRIEEVEAGTRLPVLRGAAPEEVKAIGA